MLPRAQKDLDLLSIKLHRVQLDYENARKRGDAERVHQCRIQMSAMIAERDRLMNRFTRRVGAGTALV